MSFLGLAFAAGLFRQRYAYHCPGIDVLQCCVCRVFCAAPAAGLPLRLQGGAGSLHITPEEGRYLANDTTSF